MGIQLTHRNEEKKKNTYGIDEIPDGAYKTPKERRRFERRPQALNPQ